MFPQKPVVDKWDAGAEARGAAQLPRVLMARDATTTVVQRAIRLSHIISSLARVETGTVSAALNAVAVDYAR